MAKQTQVETIKLIRRPLQVTGLKSLTEDDLIAEVKEVLGYGEVSRAVELRNVAAILRELDIEPFENKRVEDYKRAEAKRISSRRRYDYYVKTISGVWRSIPVAKYKKEIPAFALLRATQIKKAMNAQNITCEFFVEELTKRSQTVVVDPFMIMVAAGKKLYIDVWNEPKFEGRRTK